MKYKNSSEKVSIVEIKKEIGSFYKLVDWSSNPNILLSKDEENQREKLSSLFIRGCVDMCSFGIALNYFYELFSGKLKDQKFASIILEERLFKLHFDYFGDDEKRKIFETPEKAINKFKNDLFFVLETFVLQNNKVSLFRTKETKQRYAFLVDLLDKKESVKLSDFLKVEINELRNELILVPKDWFEIFNSEKHCLYIINLKGEIKDVYSDIYSVSIDKNTKSLMIKFESSANKMIGSFNYYYFDEKTESFSFDNTNRSLAKKYLTIEEVREELKNIINKMEEDLKRLKEKSY